MVISAAARVPNERLLGLLAVASAAALWAVAAAVASSLFDDGITPLELVQARAYVTAAGLALLPATWRRASSGGAGKSRWGLIAAFGLAVALVNLAYYVAIDRIPVAVAIVLQYSAPAMVVAWASVASRRRPSSPVLVALGGAIVGVVLVSGILGGDFGDLDALGIAMGLGAALMFAAYTLLSERLQDACGPVPAIFRGFACASFFWIIVQIPNGWPSALLESAVLPRVLFVGVAGTLVPLLLYVWGVGRMRAARASIAATLEPVLAAVIAWAWLDQSLSLAQVAGGLLVVASVVTLQLRSEAPVPPSDF
jgi:drug/metabolite transporter, DME family